MKHLILTIALFITLSQLMAQNSQPIRIPNKNNDRIVDIDTLTGIRNQCLVAEFDTLYLINQFGVKEFKRCVSDLNRLKDLSGPLNSLSGDLSTIQTNVDSLYGNMKSLTQFINQYQSQTTEKLNSLSADNAQLTEKMQTINKDLNDARQKIKTERWNSLSTKMLWGAGGFVGGLIVASLFLL